LGPGFFEQQPAKKGVLYIGVSGKVSRRDPKKKREHSNLYGVTASEPQGDELRGVTETPRSPKKESISKKTRGENPGLASRGKSVQLDTEQGKTRS